MRFQRVVEKFTNHLFKFRFGDKVVKAHFLEQNLFAMSGKHLARQNIMIPTTVKVVSNMFFGQNSFDKQQHCVDNVFSLWVLLLEVFGEILQKCVIVLSFVGQTNQQKIAVLIVVVIAFDSLIGSLIGRTFVDRTTVVDIHHCVVFIA